MDRRWLASFILILAFAVLGLSTALIGPALPDLAYATSSNIKEYTSVFFGRAIGFLIGVVVSGKIVDRYDQMVLIGLSIFICGVVLFTIGLLKSIWQVAAAISSIGFAMGILDTAGNVFVLQLWNRKGEESTQSSVLQAVHAGFAIGGMLCAPLARPFLGEYDVGGQDIATLNSKDDVDIISVEDWQVISEGRLDVLFPIVGAIVVLISILFFIEFKFSKRSFKTENNTPDEENEEELIVMSEVSKDESLIGKMSRFELELAILLFAFFVMCVGSEITFAQFIYVYTQQELAPLLNSSNSNSFVIYLNGKENPVRDMASFATFLFWLGFCMFRCIAIIQSRYMSAKTMLWINLTGCVGASATLLFSYDITLSFLAIFVFGASLAFSFAQTLVNVSGALASKFVVGAAVGWMTLPSLAGVLFAEHHRIIPQITLSASIINSVIMLTVQYRGEKHKNGDKQT